MAVQQNIWPKHITVDKRIVRILSESTYDSFPNALREIITNSYDADSSIVKITVDLSKELIEILDNGKGMSEQEFEFFTRIAGIKREKEGTTPSGRYIIGKFGVGFLSIFPFFKNYTIETTKKGFPEVLVANVPCYKYFSQGQLMEVSDIPIQGEIKYNKKNVTASYTKITLTGFTSMAKAFFKSDKSSKHRQFSIQSYGGLDKLKWKLEDDLPISYHDSRFNVLSQIYSPNLKFEVYLNEERLFRKTFASKLLEVTGDELPFEKTYGTKTLRIDEKKVTQIGKIKFQYFILTNKIAVHPYEGRGLKIRNLNAGVGIREAFGLGSEVKGGRSRLQWLTGEILVLEGLNDLISVSRDKFYYDPDYEEFRDFFVKKLSHHSNQLEEEAEYFREQSDSKIKKLSLLADDDYDITDKISKKITINKKSYNVKVSKWDYKKDTYPACKIENKNIIINRNYPLFKKVKHTDVFVKFHLLILTNLNDGSLNEIAYKKILDEMLFIYQDYI